MDATEILAPGPGLTPPWCLIEHRLDTGKQPHVLAIRPGAERGALFACPECGVDCKAHDCKAFTWCHLNFFQHHCVITAKVARTACPEHGVKRISVPRARDGSGIVEHHVSRALFALNLLRLKALAFDETASKKGHNSVTVFIDLDRKHTPWCSSRQARAKPR